MDDGMIGRLLIALIPTILIEGGVLWLMGERRKKVLGASVVVNVLTNVPLNLYLLLVNDTWATILMGEVIVVVVETLWYLLFVKRLKQAFIYSALCNATSFLIGLLFFQIMICLISTLDIYTFNIK